MEVTQQLIEKVTAELMKQLQAEAESCLIVGDNAPLAELLSQQYRVETKDNLMGAAAYDYIVIPASYLCELQYKKAEIPVKAEGAPIEKLSVDNESLDLTQFRLISERMLADGAVRGVKTVMVSEKAIVTALAQEYLEENDITLTRA